MPNLVDQIDSEAGNGSVTPLRYAPYRGSRIPSITDLTGVEEIFSSTAAANAKVKHPRKTAGNTLAKNRPPRSTADVKNRPPRSTAGVKNRPPRSTAAPPQATFATVHSSADLMTSTVISMPEAIENENYIGVEV